MSGVKDTLEWPYNAFANAHESAHTLPLQHPAPHPPPQHVHGVASSLSSAAYAAPPPPTPLTSGAGGSLLIRGVGLAKMAAKRWQDAASMDEIAAVFLEAGFCTLYVVS